MIIYQCILMGGVFMSQSQKLLKEVKEEIELKEVQGGCQLGWYGFYADMMNLFAGRFGSHSHSFCGTGSGGSSGSSGYGCTRR